MTKNDCIFWYILAIIGLNFLNYKLGPLTKFFRAFFMIGYGISLLYFTTLNLCMISKERFSNSISFILMPVYPVTMWLYAYYKKKNISKIILEVYHHLNYHGIKKNTMHRIVMIYTIVIISFTSITYFLDQIWVDFKTLDFTFLTYGYETQNEILIRIVLFCQNFGEQMVLILSYHVTIYVCVIFYRSSEVLSKHNILLKIQLRSNAEVNIIIFPKFFRFVKLLRKMNKTFSYLVFVINLYTLHGIFVLMLKLSEGSISRKNITNRSFLPYYSTHCAVMFVAFTTCSSLIPEKLEEIKTTVRDFINCSGYCRKISKQNLFFLKRIENESIVYISVCRLFHVTRSNILSALGLMLTYGLLLINSKF